MPHTRSRPLTIQQQQALGRVVLELKCLVRMTTTTTPGGYGEQRQLTYTVAETEVARRVGRGEKLAPRSVALQGLVVRDHHRRR